MDVVADQANIYSILEECRQLPGTFTADSFFAFKNDDLLFLGCYLKNANRFYLFLESIDANIETAMENIEKINPELKEYIPEISDEYVRLKENNKINNSFFDAH